MWKLSFLQEVTSLIRGIFQLNTCTYKHNEIYDVHPLQWRHLEITEERESADIFPAPSDISMGHPSLLRNVDHH